MNKTDLIEEIAKKADLSKATAAKAVDAFCETVSEALKKDDTISLVGFGTFSVKERAAREGRNPKTGEKIQISAAKVPSFKAGKGLKEAVN